MPEFLPPGTPFRVGMLVYPNVTQLDLTAPHEFLSKVPGVQISLHWKTLQPVTSASGLRLIPTDTFELTSAFDLLFVPGGPGQVELMTDTETLDFLRHAAKGAKYITSVCTGTLLLAAAGLLNNYRATTHWLAMEELPLLDVIPVEERVVIDRNRVTGGGVTAGIDFAMELTARVWGTRMARHIQLSLEYDPQPPAWAGPPREARSEEVQPLLERMQSLRERRRNATKAAAENLHRSFETG